MPTTRPLRILFAWVAVSALALVSLLLRGLPLGAWATPVALGIAGCKALIVLRAFMHIGRESPSVRLLAMLSASTVALLCLGVMADVGLR